MLLGILANIGDLVIRNAIPVYVAHGLVDSINYMLLLYTVHTNIALTMDTPLTIPGFNSRIPTGNLQNHIRDRNMTQLTSKHPQDRETRDPQFPLSRMTSCQ